MNVNIDFEGMKVSQTRKMQDVRVIAYEGNILTNDLKEALLQLASKVVYVDEHGQDYYDYLYNALYPPIPATGISLNASAYRFFEEEQTFQLIATVIPNGSTDPVTWESSNMSVATVSDSGLVVSLSEGTCTITATAGEVSATCAITVAAAALTSIEAVFTQGTTVIYDSATLDSLKQYLVVTAYYDDDTSTILNASDYTLSGTLTAGISTITASYGGKEDNFDVTVTETPVVGSISAVYTQSGTVYDNDSLDSLKSDLIVTAIWSDSSQTTVPSTDYTLSGTLTAGTSTITVSYVGKTTTFTVTVTHYTRLPSGYDEVEWISTFATGQQSQTYINITVPADDVLELDFDMIASGGGGQMFRVSANTAIAFYNGGIYYDLNSARAGFLSLTLNAENTVQVGNHYVKNVTTGTTKSNTTQTGLSDLTWQLGHGNYESAQGQHMKYIKQYHGDTLVRHMIPCKRTSDNQVGYYDIVQNEFLYGTRTYTVGEVI